MKKRLDVLIHEKGYAKSREGAKRLILSGKVLVDGQVSDKVGTKVSVDSEITVKKKMPYVSRGALKLEKAYKEFKLDFEDKIICDVGASSGGFTDFSLQHGAKKVYAIDVGYGQLDQKLREDKRVVVVERTNIKDVESLPEKIDMFVIDVSFISLEKVLPIVKRLNAKDQRPKTCDVVALIKPQFEVGKKIADKYKGVIKDEDIQKEVVEGIKRHSEELGFEVQGLIESPILGAKGNKEFLIWLSF